MWYEMASRLFFFLFTLGHTKRLRQLGVETKRQKNDKLRKQKLRIGEQKL